MAAEQSHADFNSSCTAAAVRLVDPHGYLADPKDVRVDEPSDRARRWAPYLAGVPVTAGDLLNMQRDRGANLLLTSGRALDPSDAQGSLDAACAEGDDALAVAEARGAAGPEPDHERRLADPPGAAATRCWPSSSTRSSSTRGTCACSGRDRCGPTPSRPTPRSWPGTGKLAEVAADEERRLLLPQTGLTGWLMLAFGAAGFGTGLSGSYQAFGEPAGGGGGKPQDRAVLRAAAAAYRRAHRAAACCTGRPGVRAVPVPVLPAAVQQRRVVAPVRRAALPVQRRHPDRPGRPRPRPGAAGPTGPSAGRSGRRAGSPTARPSPGTASRRTCVPGISSCRRDQVPPEHPAHRARYRAGAAEVREPLGQELAAGPEHAAA